MSLLRISIITMAILMAEAIQLSPAADMSKDDKHVHKNNTVGEQSDDESGQTETVSDEDKDKKYLDDALTTILNSNVIGNNNDKLEHSKELEELGNENMTMERFIDEMDNLSQEACQISQQALWEYVIDDNNEYRKNKMIRVTAEEDEIKKQYWMILKKKYLSYNSNISDPQLMRKMRIIKERGLSVQLPQSKQRRVIDSLQRIWSSAFVCAFNASSCFTEEFVQSLSNIISIFKSSNNSAELAYYWKAYRDATGRKIRPIFKEYITTMNEVAKSENFTDAGDMWRFAFEDEDFVNTVERLWSEIKPLYFVLHDYVRNKLIKYFNEDFKVNDNLIPAHLLGNLWAQEWQGVYSKVQPYPDIYKDIPVNFSLSLFDMINEFHISLGFESAEDSYIKNKPVAGNCLPSSHDMCDGVNYRIKWCKEEVANMAVGLSRAARLLGHIQYFKHYRNLPLLYRDGPNPAFHDAVSDIPALQLHFWKPSLDNHEETMNKLLWVALEKLPLMAYAYVLDKWRWDVFSNENLENWNQHWWDLRIKETGIKPPLGRNESDLDPAAKYHVVSHVPFITYLISPILEFQIFSSLCGTVNNTEPLHNCLLLNKKEAGKLLSRAMELGASVSWRKVLEVMTNETELSTKGILQYFSPLEEFLKRENVKLARLNEGDMSDTAPLLVGVVLALLIFSVVLLYLIKNQRYGKRMFSVCGFTKNGSLDIVTNEIPQGKVTEVSGIGEDKV